MRKALLYPFLWDMLTVLLVLIGGAWIAAQFRVTLPIGLRLGADYMALPVWLYLIVIVCAATAALIHQRLLARPNKRSRFWAALGAVGATFALTALLLPQLSLLQLLYFVLFAILISLVSLRWTPTKQPLSACLTKLWRNRGLLRLWVRYNVLSRYSQTILGVLWIVMLPLATSIILAFVFSHIMRTEEIGATNFVPFLLTGLTFWALFTQGVLNGTACIRLKLDLINQIYFPREVLVIVKMGEALVDLAFTFAATLVVNALFGILPNVNYVFLPLVLAIQIAFTLGVMFFTSYLSVFVRDLTHLITVALQMAFYLTPIIYPLSIFPESLRGVLGLVNPMAPVISAYRAIIVYDTPPDFSSLCFAAVLSGLVLYTGYMFFKANEGRLTDFK